MPSLESIDSLIQANTTTLQSMEPLAIAQQMADLMVAEVGIDQKQYNKVVKLYKTMVPLFQSGSGAMGSAMAGGMMGGPGMMMMGFGGSDIDMENYYPDGFGGMVYVTKQDHRACENRLKGILTKEQYAQWKAKYPDITDVNPIPMDKREKVRMPQRPADQ